MIWLALIPIGLLLFIPFAWLSLWQTLTDLPRRFSDWLSERRERKERRRIEAAKKEKLKEILDWINRGEL